jgi:hypothetical protein
MEPEDCTGTCYTTGKWIHPTDALLLITQWRIVGEELLQIAYSEENSLLNWWTFEDQHQVLQLLKVNQLNGYNLALNVTLSWNAE